VTFPVVLALGGAVFGILLTVVAIFLILLVLVQRGRGGGLAGALGGMGGSSAFGAKAGDVFTRITIGAAAVWIILCIAASRWGSAGGSSRIDVRTGGGTSTTNSAALDDETDAEAVDGAAAKMNDDATSDAGEASVDSAAPGETGSSAPTDLGDVPGSDTPASAVEPPASEGADQ
jgi:preprotein translocase subunit SecG